MIAFRKRHPAIRMDLPSDRFSFPSVSLHGVHPWQPVLNEDSHILCVLFSGLTKNKQNRIPSILPLIPTGNPPAFCCRIFLLNGAGRSQSIPESFRPCLFGGYNAGGISTVLLGERSVILFVAKKECLINNQTLLLFFVCRR